MKKYESTTLLSLKPTPKHICICRKPLVLRCACNTKTAKPLNPSGPETLKTSKPPNKKKTFALRKMRVAAAVVPVLMVALPTWSFRFGVWGLGLRV